MGVAENEDANMDFVRPEHIKTLMLVKIKAFGNMIRETKDRTQELYAVKKSSAAEAQSPKETKDDAQMQEEEKKDPAQVVVKVNVGSEESKEPTSAAADAPTS